MSKYFFFLLLSFICSCNTAVPPGVAFVKVDTLVAVYPTLPADSGYEDSASLYKGHDTDLPEKIVAFAKTQIGIQYNYGCTSPATGFDCSGFITYVFHHFNIPVPRSSVDFTDEGKEIPLKQAKPGDIILFTGTDIRKRIGGHVGIIVENDNGNIQFIHATSGKENAVTITSLDNYYLSRFMKIRRIIP